MDSVPISSVFYIIGGDAKLQNYTNEIQNLEADEANNPQNFAYDEELKKEYTKLKENFQDMMNDAALYRASNNDPDLAKKLNIENGREQTLTQLVGLDTYIHDLEMDSKNNPHKAAANERKILAAELEKRTITQFQTAWEAYQQNGDAADRDKMNALIVELQTLRTDNPHSPFSKNLIWEDFQFECGGYTILEFNSQKYAVV